MAEIKQKFKIGDVVTLKSGSPEMTVSSLIFNLNITTNNYDKFNGNVRCIWFFNRNIKDEGFHQDTLNKVKD